jgi:Flp pilus assembly protein TadD
MGRTEAAVRQLRRTAEMYPESPGALVWLGIAESSNGRSEEALRVFRQAINVSPDFVWAFGNLGFLYGKLGRRSEAEAVIVKIKRLGKLRSISWDLAAVYAGLGDTQSAFQELEFALDRHAVDLLWLNVDYRFADLRGDPRFGNLLRKLKLL